MKSRSLAIVGLVCLSLLFSVSARAEDFRPDDRVTFNLSTEGLVSTKTAKVLISVEAAVTSGTAGTMRGAMVKAVGDIVKADWKLSFFNRSQDQTGMERWSAVFEARIPENELNGLAENAKKQSKAGLQLTVANVDFSPTLEEIQAGLSQLRVQIYKMADEQLKALNTALPGRNYRISSIDFNGEDVSIAYATRAARPARAKAMDAAGGAGGMVFHAEQEPMERSEKLVVMARVMMAAAPAPAAATK